MGRLDAALNDATKYQTIPCPDVLTSRATELDASWAKAHSRLAEVYVAQGRLQLAMLAYTKAMSLCPDNQRRTYQALHDKIEKRKNDPTSVPVTVYNPAKGGSDTLFERLKAAVPDPLTYNIAFPSPLGYLTAVDKVYTAFVPYV